MKNRFYAALILVMFLNTFLNGAAWAEKISGTVKKDEFGQQNQVIDTQTGAPVGQAKITVPSKGYRTLTDENGTFTLKTNIDGKTILSVEKEGYRPFSITIDEKSVKNPIKLGIEQARTGDCIIEDSLCHLGDDVFSENSANAGEFKGKSVGPFLTKRFNLEPLKNGETRVLIIGSVVGLDTKLAKEMGQNKIAKVYASPAEIFFNGQKIGELHINGDNQEITIPNSLIRQSNEVTIKTGRNLFQQSYIDYDDIEIMNVRIESKSKQAYVDR